MTRRASEGDAEERTTSTGLAGFAYQYLTAAVVVVEAYGRQKAIDHSPPVPALYLLGHAIELTLKAYLRQHSVTVRQLRNIGHDLDKAYLQAKELGLLTSCQPTIQHEAALKALNGVYVVKQLEYICTGLATWPRYDLVEELAMDLFSAVGPLVGYSRLIKVAMAEAA